MTTVVLLVCLLLTVYAVLARRRHMRLKAACEAAFERCYAATSPRPRFEMSYSYGEPAFLVQFASKSDAAAAADANQAFLREIDERCKDRGRKRQFKAARSVFFRHPVDPDEAKVVSDKMLARSDELDWFAPIVNPPFPGGEAVGGLMQAVGMTYYRVRDFV